MGLQPCAQCYHYQKCRDSMPLDFGDFFPGVVLDTQEHKRAFCLSIAFDCFRTSDEYFKEDPETQKILTAIQDYYDSRGKK